MNVNWPIYYFVFALFFFVAILLGYLKAAKRWALFDTPNERSSHKQITIRGAGVIYLVGILFYSVLSEFQYAPLLIGALLLGVLSFVDDLKSLSAKLRLALHFIVITSFLYSLGLLSFNWMLPLLFFFFLWFMNAYNFMDGINGITFLNTASVLVGLIWMNQLEPFVDINLLLIIFLANLVFGIFNFRTKALCFLGDVGSIPLGFLLIGLTLMLALKMDSINPFIFFVVYMLDSAWTIAQRVFQRQNIFKPHRMHLYQLLVNEFGIHHLAVASLYFTIQMMINVIYILSLESKLSVWFFPTVMILFSILYIRLKLNLLKRIKRQSSI
jgi:UDP-N-acetylmuramyl pentapeptide phosphotransferase/UDP-N-acetylglucosamine-1-phosphate transferase